MSVVNTWEIEGVKVPKPFERVLKLCMSPEEGSTKDFTLLVAVISPNSKTSYHAHDESGELMFIVTGRGEALIEGKKHVILPDTAIYAPLGVRHQLSNLSDETMKAICVFVPPLPSQYLEKVGKQETGARLLMEGGGEGKGEKA